MREILFRAKDVDYKEWVYGYPCEYPFGRWPCKPAIVPVKGISEGEHKFVEVIPETMGEYTGLTDKNGKQIFEGQYLYVPYNHIGFVKVVFQNGRFNAADYNLPNCEVYDNPELLGESHEHH